MMITVVSACTAAPSATAYLRSVPATGAFTAFPPAEAAATGAAGAGAGAATGAGAACTTPPIVAIVCPF